MKNSIVWLTLLQFRQRVVQGGIEAGNAMAGGGIGLVFVGDGAMAGNVIRSGPCMPFIS